MNDKRHQESCISVTEKLRSISDTRLRKPDARGIDDPWGFCFWIYHIDEVIQKQRLRGLTSGVVGLTFDLADLFAKETSNIQWMTIGSERFSIESSKSVDCIRPVTIRNVPQNAPLRIGSCDWWSWSLLAIRRPTLIAISIICLTLSHARTSNSLSVWPTRLFRHQFRGRDEWLLY